MGGDPPSPPKLSFLGGQQASEPVKLHLLCGNGVRLLWKSEDPLCVHEYLLTLQGTTNEKTMYQTAYIIFRNEGKVAVKLEIRNSILAGGI